MTQRRPKDGVLAPQDASKTPPRRLKNAPRRLQDGLRCPTPAGPLRTPFEAPPKSSAGIFFAVLAGGASPPQIPPLLPLFWSYFRLFLLNVQPRPRSENEKMMKTAKAYKRNLSPGSFSEGGTRPSPYSKTARSSKIGGRRVSRRKAPWIRRPPWNGVGDH